VSTPVRFSEWSVTVEFRFLVRADERVLQQRHTRCVTLDDGGYRIEEKWFDVPQVREVDA
jgi:hypothetical protein